MDKEISKIKEKTNTELLETLMTVSEIILIDDFKNQETKRDTRIYKECVIQEILRRMN